MVKALIFAGGTGRRMNLRSKPKQFLEAYGKPIIIYTLEHFEYHEQVDEIVVVCIKEWINELQGLLERYGIHKVKRIIPGGETGHDSIFLGLNSMRDDTEKEDIVLIHDGVRPLINGELIAENIKAVKKYRNGITSEAAVESILRSRDGLKIDEVPKRSEMYVAKAPQSFYYMDILQLYERAQSEGVKTIDSAHLCNIYNEEIHIVPSTKYNIKITEPADYYIFRALYEALESQQIYGV